MGLERILQAARRLRSVRFVATVAVAAGVMGGTAVADRHERVAVIDLGSGPGSGPGSGLGAEDSGVIRQRLAAAIVAGGLDPVLGDGLDDALAGTSPSPDGVTLAAAMAEAQRAFGALDCKVAIAASMNAIGIAAARQAAGLPVPELERAWTYVLLCADRTSDVDTAMYAAAHLRGLAGETTGSVPREVWAKYPAVDVVVDRDTFPVTITTDVPGAELWIDFQRVGVSPLATALPAGRHVIAAAAGTKRGWAAGTAIRTQTTIAVPMTEQVGPYAQLAARIAGWKGALPAPAELAAALTEAKARVALIRIGERVEVWGRIGRSEAPHRLGGDDGVGTVAEANRLVALVRDRVSAWNDRSPDPDQPLLVEDPKDRTRRAGRVDAPTRWWVYATLAGALVAGASVLLVYDSANDTQRVELHHP